MNSGNRIGIDLGGTKTEAILIDKNGKQIFKKRIPSEKNYSESVKSIVNLVKEIETKFSKANSIGIGMPGSISKETSLIKGANSIWLNGKPFRKDLQEELKRTINIENDANCFTLSEAVDGAAKDYSFVFGVIISVNLFRVFHRYATNR